MSSVFNDPIWGLTASIVIRLAITLVATLLALRLLEHFFQSLAKPGSSDPRQSQAQAQQQDQRVRELINQAHSIASKAVWGLALFAALPEFGINILPAAVVLAGLAVAFALTARSLIADLIAGFSILSENQFAVGDTIQLGAVVGRVEQISYRRTLLREVQGALVTIANGELRSVSNLSRDWSQTFVDLPMNLNVSLEQALPAVEAATAALRTDPAWSQALVDGPRILGIEGFGTAGYTLRLQVRSLPNRHHEVARELRRRLQMEFHQRALGLQNAPRSEKSADPGAAPANPNGPFAS
jgi:small conductance mechanosensitive channel